MFPCHIERPYRSSRAPSGSGLGFAMRCMILNHSCNSTDFLSPSLSRWEGEQVPHCTVMPFREFVQPELGGMMGPLLEDHEIFHVAA